MLTHLVKPYLIYSHHMLIYLYVLIVCRKLIYKYIYIYNNNNNNDNIRI